jgi:hypothetical protein
VSQVIDFLTGLSCLYLFYCLGMRLIRERAKIKQRANKEVMRDLL